MAARRKKTTAATINLAEVSRAVKFFEAAFEEYEDDG
jgi:hypothetical protein